MRGRTRGPECIQFISDSAQARKLRRASDNTCLGPMGHIVRFIGTVAAHAIRHVVLVAGGITGSRTGTITSAAHRWARNVITSQWRGQWGWVVPGPPPGAKSAPIEVLVQTIAKGAWVPAIVAAAFPIAALKRRYRGGDG
jgi:hypothetical protein